MCRGSLCQETFLQNLLSYSVFDRVRFFGILLPISAQYRSKVEFGSLNLTENKELGFY